LELNFELEVNKFITFVDEIIQQASLVSSDVSQMLIKLVLQTGQ